MLEVGSAAFEGCFLGNALLDLDVEFSLVGRATLVEGRVQGFSGTLTKR